MWFSFILTLSALFAYGGSQATFLKQNIINVYNIPEEAHVFIPPKYDDSDNVEITILSKSPNSCYLTTSVRNQKVDVKNKTIQLSVESKVDDSFMCAQNGVHYFPLTVNLGLLPAGEYSVEFKTAERSYKKIKTFSVAQSTNKNQDDFDYAAIDVNTLTVVNNRERREIEVTLPVTFRNTCYSFKEIKVFTDRSENVIEILPKITVSSGPCLDVIVEVSEKVVIPYSAGAGDKLVHIRSANGFSINRVVILK